jgi:hypothetical protein
MIILEVTYDLAHRINEVQFVQSLKEHLLNVKTSFEEVIEPDVFNLGNAPIGAFVVHFRVNSKSDELFSRFEAELPEYIKANFSPEISSALKTSIRALMPWQGFLS